MWLLPVGVIGALALGFASLRGTGRVWAIVALGLATLTVIGAALLLTLWPY